MKKQKHLKTIEKRLLALLMCASMIVTTSPVTTRADENVSTAAGQQETSSVSIITTWQWNDEEDILDPETGSLALPGASEQTPAYFDDVTALLPTKILATVENAVEPITLGDWECDSYPVDGAYTGSYTFTAALPEGYALSEEAEALEVLVELGGAQTYESAEGETVGAFTVMGGTLGTDYTYENNVLTIKSGEAITIKNADPSTATTTDRIEVAGGVSANITLAGVNISSAGYPAFKIEDNSTGNVTIILKDGTENTLKGGTYSAGLQKNGSGAGIGKLTIQGGTEGTGKLEATGSNSGGAGIGGYNNKSCSNIEICGGTVTANGGYNGAGIGGGKCGTGSNITISGGTVTANGGHSGAGIGGSYTGSGSDITISGGTVTANGGKYAAGIGGGSSGSGSDITISGGSVKAVAGTDANDIGGGSGNGAVTPILADGTTPVYLLEIPNPDSAEVLIDGVSYKPVNHKAVDGTDTNLYAYLTGAEHRVQVGNKTIFYTFDSENSTFAVAPLIAYATNGGTLTYDTDYTYENNVLTIKSATPITIANKDPNTATTDRIEVASGVSANITLDGVNIDVSSSEYTAAAFKIADDSTGNVTITLADGTENTLKSEKNCAGLQKNGNVEGIGKLTIQGGTNGTGELTATGGMNGAGIGGGYYGSGSNITIRGGTVTATYGYGGYGAGIGGGNGGSGSNITISGGTVTARSHCGAGIGGGYNGSGSDITISGGTVTANSYDGAGIGGGKVSSNGGSGSNIEISGGTVNASSYDGAGIGGGYYGSGSNITISGGTVTANSKMNGAGIGGGKGSTAGSTAGGSGSNITISGGTVTATGGIYGAGIGGGEYGTGSDITISGGTVTATGGSYAAGIGGGEYAAGSNITISGGTVKAVAGTDANAIGGGVGQEAVTPTSDGTTPVYLFEIANNSGAAIMINNNAYPAEHTYYDFESSQYVTEKKIYAYLPAKTVEDPNVVKVGTETTKYIYDNSKWMIVSTGAYDEEGFCTNYEWKDGSLVLKDGIADGHTDCNGYEPATDSDNDGVYEICNAGQLYWFAAQVNSGDTGINAVLTNNITINEEVLVNGELSGDADSFRSWTPIGYYNSSSDCKCYTGTFDGKNYTINGLYYKNDTANYVGLFSYVSGGKVLNVNIEDSFIRGYQYVGGVCGYLTTDGTIKNCHNKGKVSGVYYYIGGVCGYLTNGIIEDCHNEGTVSAIETENSQYIGGVCGWVASSSTIKGCYNKGTVGGEGIRHVIGGVCGRVEGYSTIQNCYNEGKVSGNRNIGGIVGSSDDSTIQNCYNVGEVSGNSYTGGVSGTNTASTSYKNCFYDKNKCNVGGLNGIDETGKAEGKTTTEFESGLVGYLLNGSTSKNPVWYQNIDNGTADTYPVLDSTHGTVYQCTPCTAVYSNTLDKTEAHIFEKVNDTNHKCKVCGLETVHSTETLTYSADEETNRITVYCNEGGCDANIGYVELAAPSGTITYDGTTKEATVSDTVDGVDFSSTAITYKQGETTLLSAPKDAGTYTASITLGTGEGAATVSVEFTIDPATPTISWGMSLGTSWVEMTEILVTYTGAEITPDKLVPQPTVTLVNNETYSGEISYSYRVKGSSDAFTSGLPTEIGTYEVEASIAADGNYKEAAGTVTLTVNWFSTAAAATLTGQGGSSLSGDNWWAQSVTFTAPNSFTISNSLTGSYGTSFDYNEQTGADGTEVTYYLKNSDGEIAEKTATVRIDRTAPTWPADGGISVKENWWKSLLNTISFGLFYKDATLEVKASAADDLSGVAAYYYYVDTTGSTTVLSSDVLDTETFTKVEGSGKQTLTSLSSDGYYVVYAYAVDAAGNKSDYVCTNGVVLDTTAPTISDITTPSKEALTLTDTSAKISFTGSEAGTCFYRVSETAPVSINDFATSDTDSQGMTVWTAKTGVSSVEMTTEAKQITLSNLSANTTYTLYLAAVDKAGNSIATVESKTFTTCKTMPTITKNPTISGTYGQTVADMTLTPGTAKVGSTVITGTWVVTDSNKTDVPVVGTTATYQVTFTPDVSYNDIYDTVIVDVKPTVSKRAITVTADDKTKTYGQENPAFTFTVPDGTLVGSDKEEALGVTLRCEATASSPVTTEGYAITGTSTSTNYNVTVTPGTLTINKADAQITVGTANYNKTFGDADFPLNVTDTNTEANVQYEITTGADVVSVSNGTVTILKTGTATITVSLPESTNYNAATSKTIAVNVAKKSGYTVDDINKRYLYSKDTLATIDLSGYAPANCGSATYGSPQVNGALYTDEGKPTVSRNGELSYIVKAGSVGDTGTIVVTVTTDNYEDFTITVNVKLTDKLPVSLKNGSSVTLQNSILTYGEALSKLTLNSAVFVDDEGNVVTGTLAWKKPTATPDAGTTSATWIFTPDNELYETLEDTVAITVNKATPQVTELPTVAARTYNPTVSLKDTDLVGGTVTGVDGNSLVGGWSWQTSGIIPIVNNTGYVAVFTPSDTTNYNTVTRTITVTVSKATPYIATAPTAAAITYGDTLSASALSSGIVQYSDSNTATVAGSFTWEDSSMKPSVADSNNTNYRVVFTPSDADNYNTAATDVTLTVNKAQNAPNMPSATMNVANSCEKVSDVTLPTGWVWQDADKNKELIVGTPVTVIAVYNGVDKGNYEKETVSVTITRSECEHAHTEIREVIAASCTADGYTGDTYCTDCSVKIKTGTATSALGHDYTSKVTTEPTTDREGVRTYTCDRCGHSYTRAIEKLQDTNNSNPGENQPGGENTPDTGKPYIKDETGKEGWDVIKDEADKTEDGNTVVVEMNGSSVAPGDVLDEIKGKDVTIVFDMGGGITWSVNGESITGDKIGDIDFSVEVGTNTIPVDVIYNVSGERYSQQISLAYDGEFGFTAVLSINMGKKNAGLFANLFYYNEQTGELEFICAGEIAENGIAELTFTHASDYAIVIDKEPMDVALNETSDTNADTSESGEKDTQTGAEVRNDAWNPWWIIVIGIMAIVIGLGVFLVAKKKKEDELE